MLSKLNFRVLAIGGVFAGASASHALALAGGFSETTVIVNANGATLIDEVNNNYFYNDSVSGTGAFQYDTFGDTLNDGSKFMRSSSDASASPTGAATGLYGNDFLFTFKNETLDPIDITFDLLLYREGSVSVDNQATEFASFAMYGGAAKLSGGVYDFRTDSINTSTNALVAFSQSHNYLATFTLAPDEEAVFEVWASTEFQVSSVPEPASMAALGLGALAVLKRRRKSA
jgi:hypothetical protein